jgi:hypothetical protein
LQLSLSSLLLGVERFHLSRKTRSQERNETEYVRPDAFVNASGAPFFAETHSAATIEGESSGDMLYFVEARKEKIPRRN